MQSSNKLNLLSLHMMESPKKRRKTVEDLEYMFAYFSNHNCIIHDGRFDLPDQIKEFNFDAIILGPTFLGIRTNPILYKKIRYIYDFIENSNAFKIALPQDDYDCSKILDDWCCDWNIDLVKTVCSDNWEALYPEYSKKGNIELGFTGYISEELIKKWNNPISRIHRNIDISYRANKLPENFGSLGYLKSNIAKEFLNSLPENNLNLDISVDPKKFIAGNKWHDFLENSKFCLSTPSGSSLLDPYGKLREKVFKYTAFRNESFQNVKKECFPHEDGRYIFTAISPRNIESGLAKTVQIATQGNYSNLMFEDEDFIKLDIDCKNIEEVLLKMKDISFVEDIAENFKTRILDFKELRFSFLIENLTEKIFQHISLSDFKRANKNEIKNTFLFYKNSMAKKISNYWYIQDSLDPLRNLLIKFGARRFKRLFSKYSA